MAAAGAGRSRRKRGKGPEGGRGFGPGRGGGGAESHSTAEPRAPRRPRTSLAELRDPQHRPTQAPGCTCGLSAEPLARAPETPADVGDAPPHGGRRRAPGALSTRKPAWGQTRPHTGGGGSGSAGPSQTGLPALPLRPRPHLRSGPGPPEPRRAFSITGTVSWPRPRQPATKEGTKPRKRGTSRGLGANTGAGNAAPGRPHLRSRRERAWHWRPVRGPGPGLRPPARPLSSAPEPPPHRPPRP